MIYQASKSSQIGAFLCEIVSEGYGWSIKAIVEVYIHACVRARTTRARRAHTTRARARLLCKNRSIGDLDLQLEFLWYELTTSYKSVLNVLKNANSVKQASDCVLTKFERPKDQSDAVKAKRANYGLEFYNKYGGTK